MNSLESTAATNGDGFGLGWYGEHPEPGLYRELRPAWSDENLRYLCRHLHSHLFFAHARAATGTSVMRPNCHPFACGQWMFMHNGFVGGWTRFRRQIEALIPDHLYPSRIGTTDSEAIFLAILGAGLVGPDNGADPVEATARMVRKIIDIMGGPDEGMPLRITAALANGRDLYAFRYAANDRSNSLYMQARGQGVIIVSEPLDREPTNWTAIPENSAIVSKAGERVRVVPFM
jgi:glutamine amidotransferase